MDGRTLLRMETMSGSWDEYFITLADHVASKSKDPSTKCGAVIVNEDNIVLATGFNGFARGVREEQQTMRVNPQFVVGDPSMRHDEPMRIIETKLDEKRWQRPQKYWYVEHAERNAIYAAARCGHALESCKIYVNQSIVCCDCARGIIQTGIKTVCCTDKKWSGSPESTFEEQKKITREMFVEAGIVTRYV